MLCLARPPLPSLNQEARHNLSHPDDRSDYDDDNECNVNVNEDDDNDDQEEDDLGARSFRSCFEALRQSSSDEKKEPHIKHRLKL